MRLEEITPLVLTYNEEANIARTLGGLSWARRVVVVDSGSTDSTAATVARFDNTELIERAFDNHTAQWNFGLEQVATPWVLTFDADYLCTPAFAEELRGLQPEQDAYWARFRYCIGGRPLRGTLYPPRIVLFRTDRYRYVADGHTQKLDVSGPTGRLRRVLLHDDRKPLGRWLAEQARYTDLEVEKLLSTPKDRLGWKDRLRRQVLWTAPLTFFYCLFGKRLILDGWPGVYYTLQRVYAELLLSMRLLERRLSRVRQETGPSTERETERRQETASCKLPTENSRMTRDELETRAVEHSGD